MPTLIGTIRNKHIVEFDSGKFDDWCIYLKRPGQARYAPSDTEYFGILQGLGNRHGHEKIYRDFVKIYAATSKTPDAAVLTLIADIASEYEGDAEEIEIWFTVIYAGMIAEENKAYTKLGKRIKRLGMHQTLLDKLPPHISANFSRNMKWRELDEIMASKGF